MNNTNNNEGFNPSDRNTEKPMEFFKQAIQEGITQALSQMNLKKLTPNQATDPPKELDIEEKLKKEKDEVIKQHQKEAELKARVQEEIQLEKDLDEINKGTYSEQTQKIMDAYRNSLKDDKKTLVKSLKKEALSDFFSKEEHNSYLPSNRQSEIDVFKKNPDKVNINEIWRLKNDVIELKQKEDQRKLEQKKEKGLTLNMNPTGFKKIYGI